MSEGITSADGWTVAYVRPEGVTFDRSTGGSFEVPAEHFERVAEAFRQEQRNVQVFSVYEGLNVAMSLWQGNQNVLDNLNVLAVPDVPGQVVVKVTLKPGLTVAGGETELTARTQGDLDELRRLLTLAERVSGPRTAPGGVTGGRYA